MARDLVLYGDPTLERALRSVGQLWRARSGIRVNVFVAPSDLSYAQIERGARCDVIVLLAGAVTEGAARRKIIEAGTLRRVLRNGLALIGSEASTGPAADATTGDLARLIAGKTLAIANPDRYVAGAYAVEMLRKAGVTVGDGNKGVVVAESSAGVVSVLAANRARLGIVYATDAAGQGGFRLNMALPGLGHPPIEYVAAVANDPQSDPRPVMAFLTSAEAKATFTSAGLQTIEQ